MPKFKQKRMEPTQLLMFAPSLDACIPPDSDVRVLSEAMDFLDWSKVEASYSETGNPAYPPEVLAKVLVYGYSKGIRSSRELEEATKNDKRYIWLAGGLEPDHCTIARFRKNKEEVLKALFQGSVRLCSELGLVLLNTTATDGSKIRARASKKSLYDQKRIAKERAAIDRIFAEAEEIDRLEDEKEGFTGKVPAELADPNERKKRLAEIARRLQESGTKSVSATEEECRVMKTTVGLRPAYNMQLTVDTANLVIVAADVTDRVTDNEQLPRQIEQVEENTGCKPDVALADKGYSDEVTYCWCAQSGQDVLIPPKEQPETDSNNRFASKHFVKDGDRDVLICPVGNELTFRRIVQNKCGRYRVYTANGCRKCPHYDQCVKTKCKTGRSIQVRIVDAQREAMKQRLKTEEGKALYHLRQQSVEIVFADIKSTMGLDRFRMADKAGAKSETWLACLAHNLRVCKAEVAKGAQSAYGNLLNRFYFGQFLGRMRERRRYLPTYT